ncbi:MAG: hypothetical protein GY799_00525 [Desulfobulbaceae bacterium]|nr:hypothetical protein [Desulfobulbaceae bacterium]
MKNLREISTLISTICKENNVEIHTSSGEFDVYRVDDDGRIIENHEWSGIVGIGFEVEVKSEPLATFRHVCRFCGESREDEFYINSVTGEKTEGCKKCEDKKMSSYMEMN